MESVKFRDLDDFLQVSAESDSWTYTVAWADCMARGRQLGRGIYMRGEHAAQAPRRPRGKANPSLFTMPVDAPGWVLNRLSVKAFNLAYYHKQQRRLARSVVHYEPFFYPLDMVNEWHRIYGSRGFLQYQFVMPVETDDRPLATILERIAASGIGSFLMVIKRFGDVASPGMMSFPAPGVTVALDFPNVGPELFTMLTEIDRIVETQGGRSYSAKDARMDGAFFRRSYPRHTEFQAHIDPRFHSDFWRRMMA